MRSMRPSRTRRQRGTPFTPQEFWQHVDRRGPIDCWEWRSTVLNRPTHTYGAFWHPVLQRTMSAHRVAWLLTHGRIPKGLHVCHACDNPLCCNAAAHLFLGTPSDNQLDSIAKGRRVLTDASRRLMSEARRAWWDRRRLPAVWLGDDARERGR